MRRTASILVIASALIGPMSAHAQDAALQDRVLTLDDSVKIALNNSQVLLSSREDVEIALQRVREAESLFFPSLSLGANWSKFGVNTGTPMLLQPSLGTTLVPSSPRQNFYTTRADIYQSVYEGGRSKNLWQQARISYERAKSANESLQTQVSAGAKQAFYDLLFAQEKKRYLGDLLKKSDLRSAAEGGTLTEQLHLESELALIRTRASEAVQAEQDAERAYLQALNLELDTTVLLKGDLETHPVTLDLAEAAGLVLPVPHGIKADRIPTGTRRPRHQPVAFGTSTDRRVRRQL